MVAIMVKLTNVKVKGKKKIYHFWMNVPKDLQGHYGRTVHTESLYTSDPMEAGPLANALTAKYKKEHREIRAVMKSETKKPISASKGSKKKAFDLSAIEFAFSQLSEELIGFSKDDLNSLYHKIGSMKNSMDYAIEADLTIKSLEGTDLHPILNKTLAELCLELAGVEDLSDDVLRRKTARLAIPTLQKMLSELEAKVPPLVGKFVGARTEPQLVNGQWVDVPLPKNPTVSPVTSDTGNSSAESGRGNTPFSEVYKRCLKAKQRGEGTINRMRSSTQLLIDWYGDKPITYYTKDRMRDFVSDCLMNIPPNMKKVKPWRTMTLKEIVKETIPEDVIEPDTMHNKLADLTTVFTFAFDDDYIAKHPSLKLSSMLPDRAEDADRSYCKDTLKRMLNLLSYDPKKPSRYWAVLIGLFTGARRGEICQLHTNDIVNIDGIDCICINDEDADTTYKRVKNKPSKRTVPIHPSLVESGFLEYVRKRKDEVAGDPELLFSELSYSELDGYGRQIGWWFAQFRKEFKPTNKNERGFHSLRHTFIMTAQNEAEMADREILELTGHETPTISKVHKQYAHALKPDRLYKELIKLDYGLKLPSNPFMKKKATK